MIHLVTFADESMSRGADLCEISARRYGVSRVWHFNKAQIWAAPFYEAHKQILDSPRGVGFWLWKPYLIKIAIDSAKDGDILIYADAGVEFINNVNYIIDRMDQDIFLFGNNWEHAHWCKRDIIDAVFSQETLPQHTHWTLPIDWEIFGKQCQASVIFFRVSNYSRKFVAEWLKWCLFEDGRLIDDSPSRFPNHPEFQENRHDQAILTTLAYREGIKLHYWPASYNDSAFTYEKLPEYAGDDYPILFNHHRLRNHEFEQKDRAVRVA